MNSKINLSKLNFSIIGCGRLGSALAIGLFSKKIKFIYSVDFDKKNAQRLSKIINSSPLTEVTKEIFINSDVVFLTVFDKNIEVIAKEIKKLKIRLDNKYILHCSGTVGSNVLAPLKRAGAEIFSIHPNYSFPLINKEYSFTDVPFVYEGKGKKGEELAKMIIKTLGGKFFRISAKEKPVYHAASVMLTNFLITLLDSMDNDIFRSKKNTTLLYAKLIESLLNNFYNSGKNFPLSGPLVRRDTLTIKNNLSALGKSPVRELYKDILTSSLDALSRKKLISNAEKSELLKVLNTRNSNDCPD